MRALGFILTVAFLVCGASVAGTTDTLPNAGLFSYTGSPIASVASPAPVRLAMANR